MRSVRRKLATFLLVLFMVAWGDLNSAMVNGTLGRNGTDEQKKTIFEKWKDKRRVDSVRTATDRGISGKEDPPRVKQEKKVATEETQKRMKEDKTDRRQSYKNEEHPITQSK